MLRKYLLLTLVLIVNVRSHAQCHVVSDTAGTLKIGTQVVNYSVLLSGGASMLKWGGPDSACGVLFPLINAPWSGNMDSVTTVSYLFSAPISTVNVILAYVGIYTMIRPESFTITTNSSIPILSVNAGSCTNWIINQNKISSPSVIDAMNVIVNVSSVVPFTTFSIISDSISSTHGGSQYGLCDEGLYTSIKNNLIDESRLSFYPNPCSDVITIKVAGLLKEKVEIQNMFGEIALTREFKQAGAYDLDISFLPSGTYFVKIFSGKEVRIEKLLVQ